MIEADPAESIRSPQADEILRLIMAGDFVAAKSRLQSSRSDLSLAEAEELEAQIGFQTGEVRPSRKPGVIAKILWFLLLRVDVLTWLCAFTLRAGLAFGGKYRVRLFNWTQRRLLPRLIFARYSDFLSGFLYSWLLTHLASAARLERASLFYQGVLGHFECVGGRFDRGLANFSGAVAELKRMDRQVNDGSLKDPLLYLYAIETEAIYALHLSYVGNFVEADEVFGSVLSSLQTRPYFFTEVFIRSMRMYASMERLDDARMCEDALRLKEMLGESNQNKYALRTAAFAALLAAIRKDFVSAKTQLLVSEEYYGKTLHSIELGRYHFLRSLIELELGQVAAAQQNVKRALSVLSPLPGALYFSADALTLMLEVRLRSLIYSSAPRIDAQERKEIRRRLRILKFIVKGSPLFKTRIMVLESLAAYIDGDFEYLAVKSAEASREARVHGYGRQLHLLSQVQPNQAHLKSLLPQSESMDSNHEASVLDRIAMLLVSEDLIEAGRRTVTMILGADGCEVTTAPAREETAQPYSIRQSGPRKIEIALNLPDRVVQYSVINPLVNLQFDNQVRKTLGFALTVIYSGFLRSDVENRRTREALGELAAQVAHDIRSPLSALNVAVMDLATIDDGRRQLIRAAAKRINDIADDLINRHRKKNGVHPPRPNVPVVPSPKLDPEPEPVYFVLDSILSEKRLQYGPTSSIRIHLDASPEAVTAAASINAVGFKRIISNVINNSAEAISSGGDVRVFVEVVESKIVVRISDNGPGIPASLIPRVGERGFTFGKSGRGSGLGLHHAMTTVRSWGGDVKIESHEGIGTTVTLTLLRGPKPDWLADRVEIGAAKRISILDDDPLVRRAWERRIRQELGEETVIDLSDSAPVFEDKLASLAGLVSETFFIMDYELLGDSHTGLDLITKHGLAERAILVTGRHEDPVIRDEARAAGVSIVPKSGMDHVAISVRARRRHTPETSLRQASARSEAVQV